MTYEDALKQQIEILQDWVEDLRKDKEYLWARLGYKVCDSKPKSKTKIIQLDTRKCAV